MNNKDFIQKYEELLNSGYCECNELNCLDNNPPKKMLNIMKEQQQEIERLTKALEFERQIKKDVREYIEEAFKEDEINEGNIYHSAYDEIYQILDKVGEE